MITRQTLETLADRLDEVRGFFERGENPPVGWIKSAGWLAYDVRRDLEKNRFSIDGLVSEEESQKRISELEDENEDLRVEIDKHLDAIDRLDGELFELKHRMESTNG